ncbi:glycosyl hydrolase family 18 protein [Murimonas intestini]|uniref:Spore germination protein YaaH n=1 Tax=Murimonas intestini TaxID=1337051 RepID=A0AB73T5T3_9FIRM|nr:glycosyl hydrolase family 18 protein [Murimonas intestini]MCR1841955.1 glycosyl hydrolase family 18 protein [Murimonas intestini]MCR1865025.1 glycosyl hydrolase family 18 protein [Murimonas intestini]MCR1885722.1 glycosyl hydrolase family 18 protein [Murimonas intestini]
MKKKLVPILAAVILIVIVAAIGIITSIVEKYTPTDEKMAPNDYFGVASDEQAALILQNQLVEDKGLIKDGVVYLGYNVVKNYLNRRFYWDSGANLMVYTTPTDIINIPAGGKNYTVSGNSNTETYEIIKVSGTDVYIAADFVQKYTNMEYELIPDPNHVLITYQWGDVTRADMKKADSVRYQGGIKSPILTSVAKGDTVTVLETMEDWTKVLTSDGYIGYVRNKKLGEARTETTSRAFEEPVYTSAKKDYKINMVWHQITNDESNYNLLYDLQDTKGLNTISPTWFSIASNDGDVASFVNSSYVDTAHAQNLEVWALVDNFNEEVSTATVLGSTASREKLSNQLIASAIQYNLDGINVDFEALTEDSEEGYIQFIRELSVKCRKNGLVLSVDVPVPQPYNNFYSMKELGTIVDYVIIMGYDEHYNGSDPGSVASLPFVRAGVEAALKDVPSEKTINAVPFYTRIWTITPEGEVSSQAVGMDTADQALADNAAEANWSTDTSQDYGEYQDADGNTCKIWLENEKSIEEKAKLVKEFNLGGIAAWKLGFERSDVWDILLKYAS